MANSNVVIGKVVVLQGHATIRAADGTQVELKLGDPVHEGDVIITGPGAVVQLGFADGESYVVHQNETITVDASVFAVNGMDAHNAAVTTHGGDLKEITDAIASGNSLDQLLEAPQAGLGGGGDGNSGHSFVQLVRIVEGIPTESTVNNSSDGGAQSGHQSSGAAPGLAGPDAMDTAASEMVTVAYEQPVTIHLSGVDTEASIVSFTVTNLPTNGTLYLADGKTPVFVGEVINAVGNSASVVFVPSAGTNALSTTFQYTATDALGTTSSAATGTINVTPAPIITIDPLHTVNGAEAASTAPIAVTGTVGSNVPVGDTVTLTVGGQSYTGTVQAGGTYSIGIPGNVLAAASANSIHASVTMTDAFGDTGTATADQAYAVELTAPPITIAINPIATVNGAEAASSSPINIIGTVSSNVPVGDTVSLTVGGHTYTGTVQTGGSYSIGIPGSVLAGAGGDNIVATVSMTDAAGNVANASASQGYTVELTAPPIAVSINPIATINGAEAASSAPVSITGVVTSTSGGPIAGDTVTVTVNGVQYTGTVQPNGSYSVPVPGNVLANAPTDSVHVSVSGTDPAGNVATASADQTYTVELTAPPIAISIDPIGIINHAAEQGPVAISGIVSSSAGGPIAGDTVTLSVGGQTYTGIVQAGGSYSITVPGSVLANASADSVHVSVSGTDPAGNVATASANQSYGVELTAPAISIGIDPIAIVNSAEAASSAPIAITGTVGSNVPVGDTITLTVGGQNYTGTVQAGGTYSIGVPGTVLAGATVDSVHASVSTTDAAGNVATASADQAYTVELTTPAISIGIDPIGTINSAEAASSSPIAITGTVSSASGGPIAGDTVTLTVNGSQYTGTVLANGSYSIAVPGNVLATATTDSVHVSVSGTDAAGNIATASADQSYTVSATGPTITIGVDPIATINGVEGSSANPVAITGTVGGSGGVSVQGDTVTLTVNGNQYTGTVLANGSYSIAVPGNVLATAPTDSVHVSISGTDATGNVATASADQAYTVELTAPAIAVGIDPIGTINSAEAASGNPIAITGTVSSASGGPIAGDTVTLTVNGNQYIGTVLANGSYSISVPGNVLATAPTDSVHVSVSGTDAAGNVATASADQTYSVSATGPTISIGVDPIATINGAEGSSANPVAITGTVIGSGGVSVQGDTVTLTVSGNQYTGTVLANGSYSIPVPGNVLASAPTDSVHVSVSGADAAGNVATASADQAYTVELTAPAITIGIDPIATVNSAEAASSTPIAITGTVSANVPVGDTVTLTINGQNYTGAVQAGGTYSIGVPGSVLAGATVDSVHATVSTTDAAGNVATASADQAYTVELTASAIAIGVDPIATVNGAEAASSNPVAITGTVSANVPVGDTVTILVDGHTYTGTVQAGGTYNIGVPGNILAAASTDSIVASVSTTDAAGNVANASATQTYGVELAAPAITIGISSIATINGAEAASSNPISITGTVSNNVPVGNTVTILVDGHTYTGTVQAGGTYSIGVPGNVLAGATVDSVHATVSTTDAAGNVATASADQIYTVELSASAISIGIDPIATVNGAEAASSNPVAITGTVSAHVPVGDTVTLSVDGHTYAGTVQAGGTYSIGVPGNILGAAPTDSIVASISMTDAAGNVASATAIQAYTVEVTAPAITIGINSIATVNGAEAASSSPITITGTVSANVPVGDTVTLSVDGHTYTGAVQVGGTYSIGVPGNILAAAPTDSIVASVSMTDAAGNVANASATQAYTVELTAPAITIGINSIATVNGAEAASSNPIAITGAVSNNVPVGDTVTLSVDGHTYTGAVQVGGTYSIGVPGNILAAAPTDSIVASVSMTDAAGNVANASATQTYGVELAAPAITIGINSIATVNGAEAASSSPITITGTVSNNIPVGDTVTLSVGGHTYTGTVQTGDTYSIGVPGNILAAAPTDSIVASVSMTDAAGNVANASATQTYGVELTAPAITIGINSIAIVNSAEGGSTNPIFITGTVSNNVPVGDTVTLSVDGHTYTGTVQTGGTYSIGVPGNILAAAPTDSVVASVSMTDAAGNVANASANQSYTVDLTIPDTPAVAITTDSNHDGVISGPELNGSASVTATVTLDAAGQTILSSSGSVQVTVNDAGIMQTLNLQMSGGNLIDGAGHIYAYSSGVITLSELAPGNGNAITVTASETDVNGNASLPGWASATENITTPDTLTVAITTDANHDGVISATELNGAVSVTATVTLDATGQSDLTNGGTIQVKVVDNGSTQNLNLHLNGSGVLVDASGNTYGYAGGVITLSERAPGNGNSINVTATETDVYGNLSAPANANATEHIMLPDTPTVAITTDTNHDGVISFTELNGATNVTATVTLDATGQSDLTNGGAVQVTVIDNGVTQNLNLHLNSSNVLVDASGNTYGYTGGVITLTEKAPGNGNSISVTATETDVYGNLSTPATASALENTTLPPAPTTLISTDSNHDGYISAAELNGSSTVNATITLLAAAQTDLSNGGSVQVTVIDDGVTQNLVLHINSSGNLVDASNNQYAYSSGVITLAETAPGNGNNISVSATVTDNVGNVSVLSNVAVAQQDVLDAPAVAISIPTALPAANGLSLETWVSNSTVNGQLYTAAGNNGDGTNPGTLINVLNSSASSGVVTTTTTVTNASVAAGTASELTGLVYLQSGHTYKFTGTEDDSFALVIGGKLVGSTTWGEGSGAFSGTFTASATGWYTVAAYHDNQSGPGDYSLNVSDNGATAVALSSANFDLVQSTTALTNAGVVLSAEVTTTTTTNIVTTSSNSSGAGTVPITVSGGYYTESSQKPVAAVTLDSNDQGVLTAGGTMNVTTSDGTNLTLHLNGSTLEDSSGNAYIYSGGVLSLPITSAPVVTASATVYDSHGVASLTSTATEIYSGSNSITEFTGGDTFKFELAANGTAGTPNVETISAFNSNTASNGGDVLNLADLLSGATASNIGNYLHFTTATNASGVVTTTVHVSETGAYSSGYSAAADTLQIALTNIDLIHSAGSTLTDAAIIQSLLNKGKLVE